jgi:methyl-accepting chemotaxis protein-1 (serine sensor receptor)
VNSYQLFYGAIKEQAEGLIKTNTIDAFLPSGSGVSV